MSGRRVGAGRFTGLPSDAVYIEFPRSDGQTSKWPKNTTRIIESDGMVNYNEYVPLDHPTSQKWRKDVGMMIALDQDMPNPEKVVLRDWPANYRMFIHNKGPPNRPRQDVYLYGSQSKYRSINEFKPHAIWLMRTENTVDPILCACRYCTHQPQAAITSAMDRVYAQSSPAPSAATASAAGGSSSQKDRYQELARLTKRTQGSAPRARQPRPVKELIPKVFATVQKVPKEAAKLSSSILKQTMLAERSDDLRAVYSPSANKMQGIGPIAAPLVPAGIPFDRPSVPLQAHSGLRRWYRTGEVVWLQLPGNGITISKDLVPENESLQADAKIEYWLAVVESANLKCTPIPNASGSAGGTQTNGESSTSNQPQDANGSSPGWSVKQRYIYSLRLLGVDLPRLEEDGDRVLPYLAYNPPTPLMQMISQLPIEYMDFDRHKVATFNPLAAAQAAAKDKGKGKAVEGRPTGEQTPYDAASAFGLSCQLGVELSQYWCVTDRYEFRYVASGSSAKEPKISVHREAAAPPSVSASTSRTHPPLPPTRKSVAEAIAAAGKSNAVTADYYTHQNVARPSPSSSRDQLAEAAVNGLGVPRGMPSATKSNKPPPPASQAILSQPYGSISTGPMGPPPVPAAAQASSSSAAANKTGTEAPSAGDLQVRFQGLYWGTERIWEGDTIRLKMSRGQLAPNGAPNIRKPSGPGRQLRMNWYSIQRVRAEEERTREMVGPSFDEGLARRPELAAFGEKMAKLTPDDVSEWGAKNRGVFMKVNAFFMVDLNKEGKAKKEMRVSGMLYEVADEDYAEGDDERDWEKDPRPESQATVDESPLPTTNGTSAPEGVAQRKVMESAPPKGFDLPQPPHKYKFRPIITEGYEAVMSLSLVAGRYYPRICCHPIIASALHQALVWTGNRLNFRQIWSLEGMYPGYHADTNAAVFKKSRTFMIEDADRQATSDLQEYHAKMQQGADDMQDDEEEDGSQNLFGDDDDDDVQMDNEPSTSQEIARPEFGQPVGLEPSGMDVDMA
ncbi:hypothetical protein BKA70DRAFT_1556492 [Coprinopsis sp. MPI-PUGE-AT-0042]|nr:hypothetical protein BKA70DRAFT_1556492 [Coprinopsis sp. MPI-PUGE-AT-0042]